MSMNATFVQVDPAGLSRLQADPSLAETLFEEKSLAPPALTALMRKMQDRVRAGGPLLPDDALSRLPPALRQQIEGSLGRTTAALAAGGGGDAILKLMEGRSARGPDPESSAPKRAILSLDKAWHGVHYVLCGEVELGEAAWNWGMTRASPVTVRRAISRRRRWPSSARR